MSGKFVVVNTNTWKKQPKDYNHIGHALRAAQLATEKYDRPFKVMTSDEWRAGDGYVEVETIHGSTVKIRLSERGNPALDPSMEGYWCM